MRKIASRRGIILALAIIADIFLLSSGLTFAGVGTVTPTIVTAPDPASGPTGIVLNDSATLSDGLNPGGTITFKLYGVNDQTCEGAPIFTSTVPVSGNGVYSTSPGFPTVEAGTYHWVATYSGDLSNDSVSSICANEAVVVSRKPTRGQGESLYVAIVGNDCIIPFDSSNPDQPCRGEAWYWSQKLQQFMLDQEDIDVPVCSSDGYQIPKKGQQYPKGVSPNCEQFRSNKPLNQPEICDASGTVVDFAKGDWLVAGLPNAVITKQNAGWFEWWIRLPKKPSGEINICIQCGVLKPNTFTPFTEFGAIEICAAETGERIGTGSCTNDQWPPGINPIVAEALPKLEVIAYPGPYTPSDPPFKPFHLTAYKNPSDYIFRTPGDSFQTNEISLSTQVLDGTYTSRILLKACMDKCVVAKIPVTGQANSISGEVEFDLEAGDLIQVRMTIPGSNTVDIYCNPQSASLRGIGEGPF